MIEITKQILLRRSISFWAQKWAICVFCDKSFTVFLGRYLSLKFSPCENDGMFGYGFDVLWCHGIVMHYEHFLNVSCSVFLYIVLYTLLFVGFDKLHIAVNVFMFLLSLKSLFRHYCISSRKKNIYQILTTKWVFFLFQYPHLGSKIIHQISTIRGLFRCPRRY